MAPQYVRPGDEILADMRDACDLRLALRRGGAVIQMLACAKFNRVSLFVAADDPRIVEMREHDAAFRLAEPPRRRTQRSAEFGFWFLGEKGPERDQKELNVPSWRELKGNYDSRFFLAA
jgi:hypothetical protein